MPDYNARRDFRQCLALLPIAAIIVTIAAAVLASIMEGPLP